MIDYTVYFMSKKRNWKKKKRKQIVADSVEEDELLIGLDNKKTLGDFIFSFPKPDKDAFLSSDNIMVQVKLKI